MSCSGHFVCTYNVSFSYFAFRRFIPRHSGGISNSSYLGREHAVCWLSLLSTSNNLMYLPRLGLWFNNLSRFSRIQTDEKYIEEGRSSWNCTVHSCMSVGLEVTIENGWNGRKWKVSFSLSFRFQAVVFSVLSILEWIRKRMENKKETNRREDKKSRHKILIPFSLERAWEASTGSRVDFSFLLNVNFLATKSPACKG